MPRRSFPAALAACALACSVPAPVAPPPSPVASAELPRDPQVLRAAVRDAYAAGDFTRGLALVKRLLEVSTDKVTAYDAIGSIYFSLGRGAEAMGMWEAALPLETDPKRRAELAASVSLARRSLGLPEPKPAAAAKPPKKPAKTQTPADPRRVELLYQEGLVKYAKGEYLAATTLFMRALELDPKHTPSIKALERLKLNAP
ncbi:MAG: hypothetical protein HYZ75_18810 [Elusimicrobia bacterium]|nr:hypothetical protein [Elusimicrobiota bacterium]